MTPSGTLSRRNSPDVRALHPERKAATSASHNDSGPSEPGPGIAGVTGGGWPGLGGFRSSASSTAGGGSG
jgi:hypothetical protein